MANTKKLIGHVGVDSGQILICDPCYINSGKPEDSPGYPVIAWSNQYNVDTKFDEAKRHYVNSDGSEIKPDQLTGLTNSTCCLASLGTDHQRNYAMGHPGIGVCVGSGYGDGYYPVYGTFNEDGRCIRVTVEMG